MPDETWVSGDSPGDSWVSGDSPGDSWVSGDSPGETWVSGDSPGDSSLDVQPMADQPPTLELEALENGRPEAVSSLNSEDIVVGDGDERFGGVQPLEPSRIKHRLDGRTPKRIVALWRR